MANARILVTGAGGFIGSHLVETLVEQGHTVRAFLRRKPQGGQGNLEMLVPEVRETVETYFGDLRDADAVRVATDGVEAVFHLGGIISVPYSYRYPEEALNINVLGALHVLTAARDMDVGRVVLVSTGDVYGKPQYTPVDERHPVQPTSPYAASKVGAEGLAMSFYHSYDVPVTIVRPFNAYGPRQSSRAVVPTIISQALTRERVELGALSPLRDMTFVTDTVAGLVAAWRAGDEALCNPVNLGTGKGISIGDLAYRIIELVGREVQLYSTEERKRPGESDVRALVANSRLAKSILGWEPTVSLDEGLTRTMDWVRTNLERFRPKQYNI